MIPSPVLAVQSLHAGYGESPVVRDVSLEVSPGQVVCLMGRNGVGKTTLLKSIMGLLRPSQGQLFFEGQEITHWPASRRARAGIGYVPQGRGIFPYLTVYENLLMGFEASAERKPDRAALDEVFTLFPMLKQFRRRAAGALSGGQQQQLAFARVLVRRPKLLLLDEPTEGIQPSIMAEIEDLILKLHRQGEMTILLVEQFLDFALSVGNAFYVMETGAIVMGGGVASFDAKRATEYLSI
jgi:urea transport system ATP-binding protein